MSNNNIYGVLFNDIHVDISKSKHSAKMYATKHGYNIVTIRYNCGYVAKPIAEKIKNKWHNL